MATKYLALLTNIGAAKLAKATALGTKVEITQLAVGDGNGVLPTPNPAQTALVHELRRAPLNMLTVDPANASQIIAEQVIPEDVGGWWIREIGLFDKDGDMVAIANCAETYKPQLQEGSGRVQVIRVILIVSSTEAVTLKIDPAVVLATRQYVDSQLRAHEQSRNHPDASTTEKGFVQLSSSVTSDSESQAATSKAVKIAMDNGSARLAKDRNLSDLPNTALARQNLELGDSSTRNVGTTAGTVASGDDARITGAMQKSQNGGDIPDVAKFLQNLGLTALGIGGQGTKLPALDWQTFDFVPGAIYYVSSTDITNMPAGIFTPSSKATLVLNVSGYDGITRHIDMWWATGTTDYRKYQVVVVGFSGNKIFTVRQIFTSSGIVPVEYGGTGASTVDDVLRNWGVAKALEEKQPKDVTLTALAALVGAANKIPYFNGDDTAALTDLSQVGRDIIGKRDIAGLIQYLGISDLMVLDSTDNKWLWKLPNGVIFQVFKTDVQNTSTIGVSLDNMVTFPVAFPSECFAVLICKATYVQIIASAEIPTRTQCKIVTIPVTTPIATWTTTTILAIGR
ncbi:phage tail protein [Citrobacter freundii]|uniref:phage tail protein n=2 Tax=Enterobacteriaceae TaxID=543 RepID=UPI002166B6A1|nr:phage tail protein [Citrobacter freundii]UVV95702.1 phage tail protein [Citrobacter freundii]